MFGTKAVEKTNKHFITSTLYLWSRGTSVGIATRLWAEILGFDSRQGQNIFLFSTATRPALEPTQPPIRCVLAAVSPGVTRQGREADHSPPSNAEVKNGGATPPFPLCLHGIVLNYKIKYRDN
jgi:hypothetical protein